MQDLFTIDLKDYNPDGNVIKRPSARAIIHREEDVLLIYSKKYDYYKFPGGGIEKGEDAVSALIREVKEETGYSVIPSSIKEFGHVLRRQKDSLKKNSIFEQDNFYYFCDIDDSNPCNLSLDQYESEEEFTPIWVNTMVAARHNLHHRKNLGGDEILIRREGKVLDIADAAIRKFNRQQKEERAILELGSLDYKEMLDFVCGELSSSSEYVGAKQDIAYSRFMHTKRVVGWAKRLYNLSSRKELLNYEDVMIATIFHDVGRKNADLLNIPHAEAGIPITRDYLLSKGFESKRVEYICSLVGSHSDKDRMYTEPELDPNLVLLMEADLLDDMGALGIVMDCMITITRNPNATFEDCYDHIMRFTDRISKDNPMVTPEGITLWNEKRNLVAEFTKQLKQDIEI